MDKEILDKIIELYKDDDFVGCIVEGKHGYGMSACHINQACDLFGRYFEKNVLNQWTGGMLDYPSIDLKNLCNLTFR